MMCRMTKNAGFPLITAAGQSGGVSSNASAFTDVENMDWDVGQSGVAQWTG